MELLNKIIENIDYSAAINSSIRIIFILFLAWILSFILKRALIKLEIIWVSRAADGGEPSFEATKRIDPSSDCSGKLF